METEEALRRRVQHEQRFVERLQTANLRFADAQLIPNTLNALLFSDIQLPERVSDYPELPPMAISLGAVGSGGGKYE